MMNVLQNYFAIASTMALQTPGATADDDDAADADMYTRTRIVLPCEESVSIFTPTAKV